MYIQNKCAKALVYIRQALESPKQKETLHHFCPRDRSDLEDVAL